VVPLYNTPEKFLREMIASVQGQTYPDWQLCLADGSDGKHGYVKEIVMEYCRDDSRIVYQHLQKNGGISENTNACIDMATGQYIVLFDHDDLLHEAALYELRQAVDGQGADFIYTDEAVFSKDCRKPDSYHFKTDFSIDDLRANNYICHITCFSKELLEEIGGGFRKEFDGSQDFDLVLRLCEKAKNIVHIPKVLYYWRCHALSVASDISAKTYCIDAGRKAVESHLQRVHTDGKVCSSEVYPVIYRVTYPVQSTPLVSIVIWGRGNAQEMETCAEAIRKHTDYPHYEILLCDDIRQRNETARHAKGEYLVFMDSFCECTRGTWLEEILGVAQREDIGVVGARINYSNGIIRDVGLTVGIGTGVAVNRFFRVTGDADGYGGNLYYTHNVTAVSDSCMIVKRQDFEASGGFDVTLPEWYAGIDFSMKMKEMGRNNALNPYACLSYRDMEHRRDYSGGYPDYNSCEGLIIKRWGKMWENGDPCYNCNLTDKGCNFTVGR
jgi:GT2 family glycosyltransferase